MVLHCCICGAGASHSDVSLFSFPRNEQCRKKWMEFAGISEHEISINSRICCKHFKDDEIKVKPESTSNNGNGKLKRHRKRLTKNAVPSLKFDDDKRSAHLSNKYCLQCKTTEKRIHFKFPQNLEARNKWLKKCGYDADFFNGDNTWYLCSRHFSSSAVIEKNSAGSRNRLRLNAEPTLFMAETSNNSSTAEGTASNETTSTIDYSFFPSRILPAVNPEIVICSSTSTPETQSSSPDTESLTSYNATEVITSIEIQSDSSDGEFSTDHDFTIINNLTTPPPKDSLHEIQSKTPNVEPSLECERVSNDNERIPTTYHINSIHDYTSPHTISKLLDLHSHSNCEECTAFMRHLRNSLNASSQPSVTPVPRKSVKRRLCYAGDISTPDYASPKRARRSVHFLQGEIQKYRNKVHVVQEQNRRLRKKIKKYDDLIAHL